MVSQRRVRACHRAATPGGADSAGGGAAGAGSASGAATPAVEGVLLFNPFESREIIGGNLPA